MSSILLTPEEELEVMLNSQPAVVKPGDNHIEHMQKHSEDHRRLAPALPAFILDLLTAHIRDHMQYIRMTLQAQSIASQQAIQGNQPNNPNGNQNQSPNANYGSLERPRTDNQIRQGVENLG